MIGTKGVIRAICVGLVTASAAFADPPSAPIIRPFVGGSTAQPTTANAFRRQPLIVPSRGDFFGQIGANEFCKQITYGAAMIYRDYKNDLVLICYDTN